MRKTASCVLKRFPRTTNPKFAMSCVNRAFLLTGKILTRWGGCVKTSLCPLMRPAGGEPLEVRFAHPVRLSPATHSQGHGRPCLQRLHPRRAFPATWFIFCDSFKRSILSRLKRFPRTKHVFKALSYRLKRFRGTEFRFYPTGKRDRNKRHEREARSDV